MLTQINGLHHVTAMAANAQSNNDFFTKVLGLRRVKTTVNFDAPDVYHLYYGDEVGTPGSVMTYFPFPNAARRRPGTGEVGTTVFSVPADALPFWQDRLAAHGVTGIERTTRFGEARLNFAGPDGDGLALVEAADDRAPWTTAEISEEVAIRGFHSVDMRLSTRGAEANIELLRFMGYELVATEDNVTRMRVAGGNGADVVDITESDLPFAAQGAGSVHHVAFSVKDRATQLEVRQALVDAGAQITPVIDRDYFWAVYFRSPGGVLFEIATDEPGFDRDEDRDSLGQALKLPTQHEHLRPKLEKILEPIRD